MQNANLDPDRALVHLRQAERHVREGAQRLERLRTLVAGHPTDQGRLLLDRFEQVLRAQVESRDRLLKETGRG